MKKFTVYLSTTVYTTARHYVEAETEEEAIEKARTLLEKGETKWDTDSPDEDNVDFTADEDGPAVDLFVSAPEDIVYCGYNIHVLGRGTNFGYRISPEEAARLLRLAGEEGLPFEIMCKEYGHCNDETEEDEEAWNGFYLDDLPEEEGEPLDADWKTFEIHGNSGLNEMQKNPEVTV